MFICSKVERRRFKIRGFDPIAVCGGEFYKLPAVVVLPAKNIHSRYWKKMEPTTTKRLNDLVKPGLDPT